MGCPIHEASRRGLGAIMLRKPKKLARLVSGMAAGLSIPLTVKVGSSLNHDQGGCRVHAPFPLVRPAWLGGGRGAIGSQGESHGQLR